MRPGTYKMRTVLVFEGFSTAVPKNLHNGIPTHPPQLPTTAVYEYQSN